ncbi:hypothetical protein O1L55_40985 [Streptomyces albulus]|nr:hypothetical protein [Streptomyces noursei]
MDLGTFGRLQAGTAVQIIGAGSRLLLSGGREDRNLRRPEEPDAKSGTNGQAEALQIKLDLRDGRVIADPETPRVEQAADWRELPSSPLMVASFGVAIACPLADRGLPISFPRVAEPSCPVR